MTDKEVARAVAFFEACDDTALLQDVLRSIRPRAAAEVRRLEQRGFDAPAPATIAPADTAATREEAMSTLQAVNDFAHLQAISRAAGRRLESLSAAGQA